jgi:hypothetical protein
MLPDIAAPPEDLTQILVENRPERMGARGGTMKSEGEDASDIELQILRQVILLEILELQVAAELGLHLVPAVDVDVKVRLFRQLKIVIGYAIIILTGGVK